MGNHVVNLPSLSVTTTTGVLRTMILAPARIAPSLPTTLPVTNPCGNLSR